MFPKVPYTPGVDLVGVVDALGDGVTEPEPGTVVAGLVGHDNGAYTEFACIPADDVVPVPPGLDPAQAVCVVANYLTAHTAMHRVGKAQAGERILVHGAAGGVGSALLQLGALAGLEMFGTASRHNHELVRSLGATPIDYHTEDVVKRIRSVTGNGADLVFDPIGGARQLRRSYRVLGSGGRLVWFGVAASKSRGIRVIPSSLLGLLLLKLTPGTKKALTTPDLKKDHAEYRAILAELLELLASGKLEPVVSERIPLAEAARAHETLDRGGVGGKIVLITDA
jgi:NADPH:quinone reductase-like Zn-dependent oxidoreductase